MKDQFLVCKQARGHMSSETQGKVIEDEYARAGQTPCGQSLQQQQQQLTRIKEWVENNIVTPSKDSS